MRGEYKYHSNPYIHNTTILCGKGYVYTLPPNLSDVYNIFIVPAQPHVTVDITTTTSISLSWTSAGSEVDSYVVMWTSDECPDDVDEGSATITDVTETSYVIEGLREGTSYTITVNATNSAGTSPSDSVNGETQELGNV